MLEGRSKTFVENFSAAGIRPGSIARHNFLKLVMPLKGSNYLQPRIAEAGITYSFLFNFNIAGQLLPHACDHKVQSDNVKQANFLLPPSVGDKEVAGRADDLSPEMSKITYAVKARVIREDDVDSDNAGRSVLSQL